jgi:hypothetical protein
MLLHGDSDATIIVIDRKNLAMMNLNNIPASNIRTSVKISAAVAACLAFSACGAIAEKVTEEGAERIIESESDGDVDFDFDSGDGSFSVQTEDGTFAANADGSFVVTGENGEVLSGSANDDGLVVLNEDGDPVLNVSGDSGEISIEGEDGENVFRVVTEIPAEWPSDVPLPDGLTIEGGTYIIDDGETLMTLIGAPNNGDAFEYIENYGNALRAAGLNETGQFDSSAGGSTNAQRIYENNEWVVNMIAFVDDSSNAITISLVSQS